jgi:hypothetical protein
VKGTNARYLVFDPAHVGTCIPHQQLCRCDTMHSHGAARESKNGKVSHLGRSIHVGTCLHQHLHNLVIPITADAVNDSAVKGRLTVLQSQGQGDRV